jgi:hypothetical protein
MLTIEQRTELDAVMRKHHGNVALACRALCRGATENVGSIFDTSSPAMTSLCRSVRRRSQRRGCTQGVRRGRLSLSSMFGF